MIDNPNPNGFYSESEMNYRSEYIKKAKYNLILHLDDLMEKIKNEEPFPHGNLDLDVIVKMDDDINKILNNWYY